MCQCCHRVVDCFHALWTKFSLNVVLQLWLWTFLFLFRLILCFHLNALHCRAFVAHLGLLCEFKKRRKSFNTHLSCQQWQSQCHINVFVRMRSTQENTRLLWCYQNRCSHLIGCWDHAGCQLALIWCFCVLLELLVGWMDGCLF